MLHAHTVKGTEAEGTCQNRARYFTEVIYKVANPHSLEMHITASFLTGPASQAVELGPMSLYVSPRNSGPPSHSGLVSVDGRLTGNGIF